MTVNRTEERIELTAIDRGASAVIGGLTNNLGGLRTGLDTVKAALGAVGVTLGAGAMAAYAADVVKAAAAVKGMSESTGASIDNLLKIQNVARVNGHEFNGVTDAIGAMIRNMKAGNEEGGKAAQALGLIGVKARESNGQIRDGAQIMIEMAKALDGYEDSGNKVALVQAVLGKSGQQYMQLLKDMANEQDLASKTTAKQVEEADKLEKNMHRLATAVGDVKREFVLANTGWLVDFTDRLVGASKEGRLLTQVLTEIARAQAFAMENGISPAGRIAGGALRGATDFLAANRERYRGGPDLWNIARRQMAGNAQPWGTSVDEWVEPGPLKTVPSIPGDPDKKTGSSDDGAATLTALMGKLAQARGEASEFDTVMRQLTDGTKKYSASMQAAMLAVAGEIDEEKRLADDRKRLIETTDAAKKKQDEWNKTLADTRRALGDQIAGIELETSLIGASESDREKVLAFRQLDLDLRSKLAALDAEQVESYAQQVEQLYALYDAERLRLGVALDTRAARTATQKAAEESAKAAEEVFKERRENLTRIITDGLMRGFERGGAIARNFFETLKNAAKSVVLEPMIRFLVSPLAGAAASLFSPGMANAAGGLFGGGGGGFSPGSLMNLGSGMEFLGGASSLFGGGSAATAALIESGTVGFAGAGMEFAAGLGSTGMMSALGPIGLGLGALTLLGGGDFLGGLFGGGGGPKASDAFLQGGNGTFGIGVNNVAGGENMAQILAFNALLNDPKKYDPAVLSSLIGTSVGTGSPSDTTTLLNLIEQALTPAAAAAQANATSQERAAAAAESTAKALEQLRDQEIRITDTLAGVVRGLPSQLGIDTLTGYRDGLATSEYRAPMDRLAGARSIFEDTYARALGGDLGAVQAFPDAAQSLLGIGRDTYASGPQFQSLFVETNRALNDILARQQAVQDDILRNVPLMIRESSNDQIAEIRKQTSAVVDGLAAVQAEIRRLAA